MAECALPNLGLDSYPDSALRGCVTFGHLTSLGLSFLPCKTERNLLHPPHLGMLITCLLQSSEGNNQKPSSHSTRKSREQAPSKVTPGTSLEGRSPV